MDHIERDSGLMSAPEAEVLHELARLRCENERLREAVVAGRTEQAKLASALAQAQYRAMREPWAA